MLIKFKKKLQTPVGFQTSLKISVVKNLHLLKYLLYFPVFVCVLHFWSVIYLQGSARSRDDLDMERALRPRLNAPDVVRSTMSHKDFKYNENTIDSILGTPNKIVIPERYIPEQVSHFHLGTLIMSPGHSCPFFMSLQAENPLSLFLWDAEIDSERKWFSCSLGMTENPGCN